MSRKHGMLAGLCLVLSTTVLGSAFAGDNDSPQAECMLFYALGLGGKEAKEKADGQAIQVNAKNAAPTVEAWMNGQLGKGRTRFESTPVFTNGSVVCAW